MKEAIEYASLSGHELPRPRFGRTSETIIFPRESPTETKVEIGGDLTTVLKNFSEKRERLRHNDPTHERIRTALVLDGGAMRGVFIAGICVALHSQGVTEGIDNVVGVSTGSACGLYLVGEAVEQGAPIYFEDIPKNKFINPTRLISGVINMESLEQIFRIHRPVDVDKVRQSRTNLYIGVTDRETGEGKFLNSKDQSIDLVSAVIASSNLPIFSNRSSVDINGEQYVDGGIAHPLPVTYAVEELKSTDVLVITPYPFIDTHTPSWSESLIDKGLTYLPNRLNFLPYKLKEKMRKISDQRKKELEYAMDRKKRPMGVNIGVIYPEIMQVRSLSIDPKALKDTFDISRRATEELLSRYAA